MPFQKRPSILVVKHDSLGDSLLFTGALRELRNNFAQHHIVLVCSERAYPLLESCSYVDETLQSRTSAPGWRGRLERIGQGIRLFKRTYEIVLHPAFSTGALSHRICSLACSEKKVWFDGDYFMPDEELPFDPRSIYTQIVDADVSVHELDKTIVFLRAIGLADVSRKDIRSDACLTLGENDKASTIVQPLREHPGVLIVALCPGANFAPREWGAERYAELIQRIAEVRKSELTVLLLGGADERESLNAFDSDYGLRTTDYGTSNLESGADKSSNHQINESTIINLAGELTVRESMAVIEQCDICIGNDTFGLHAAIAVNTPSVVIMGGGTFPRYNPWGDQSLHRMVNVPMECYGCGWHCHDEKYDCINSIAVNDVLVEVKKILTLSQEKSFSQNAQSSQRRKDL